MKHAVNTIHSLLDSAEDALRVGFEPAFVMQDFKAGNTVAMKSGGHWRISGVFDFMEPYFSDGEIDVIRHLYCCLDGNDSESAVAFVSSYNKAGGFRPGAGSRMPIYALLDRLIIWNFGWRRGPWWNTNLTFREWMSLSRLDEAFREGGAPDAIGAG